jgi:hypothetical protein
MTENTGERKLSAILYAGVKDYSRMLGFSCRLVAKKQPVIIS